MKHARKPLAAILTISLILTISGCATDTVVTAPVALPHPQCSPLPTINPATDFAPAPQGADWYLVSEETLGVLLVREAILKACIDKYRAVVNSTRED